MWQCWAAAPSVSLLAQTCKALGAAKVMITDVSDYRLDLAKKCGVDYAINTKNVDFGDAMVEHFGPDKADVFMTAQATTLPSDRPSSMQEREASWCW